MLRVISIASVLLVSANAAVPKSDVPVSLYQDLWQNSPFTSRLAEPVGEDPLKHFALGGISKLEDGYYAILLDRRLPDKRVIVSPGENSGFEILEVKWPSGSWRDAAVTVRMGADFGVVTFDEKLLTVKSAAGQARRAVVPGYQIAGKTGTAQKPSASNERKPRPRIITE